MTKDRYGRRPATRLEWRRMGRWTKNAYLRKTVPLRAYSGHVTGIGLTGSCLKMLLNPEVDYIRRGSATFTARKWSTWHRHTSISGRSGVRRNYLTTPR